MADPSYAWTATVSEDFMGSLIIETENGNAYLQFQSDIDYFWENVEEKTSDSLKDTKHMVSHGYKQEVWICGEYLDAILTCNGATTCESN